ncbi:MAG: hypothetical protein ACPG5B_13835 [Chitinophagales bacterium]
MFLLFPSNNIANLDEKYASAKKNRSVRFFIKLGISKADLPQKKEISPYNLAFTIITGYFETCLGSYSKMRITH